tara:strand:+ start:58 stop:1566 length:1509 start_codon:yes stop_codon:yes gene_type:complete
MSTLNPLNDISRTYLDTIAKMNKKEEETEVKRWEGELNLQMKTMANLSKEDKDYGYDKKGNSLNPADMEEKKKKDDDLAGAPNKNGKNGKKKKRWWDDDGDGKGYEKGEVKEAVYGKTPAQVEAERRKKDNLAGAPLTVTNADKKANTKAYQNYKAGVKGYKAADHMKKESFSSWRDDLREIVSAHPITDVESEKEVTEKKGIKNKVIINPKMSEAVAEIGGQVISETEVDLQEKKDKDTPDQVKAVIAFDKARKGTRDATYDSMHGKKKQAKRERDYAKWQRDKGAEDAQKSGHRWKHAKGSTREKEGKKSETHAYIKDSYAAEGVVSKELKDLSKAGKTLKGKDVAKADKVDTPNYKGYKFGVKEAKDWIQGAVKRPGAFTRKAKAAGMSVQQFAKHVDANKSKYSTRTERQANLAQTFASMKKEDIEEMIYLMIVEDDRNMAWIQFDEGYQRNPEEGERKERAAAKKGEAIRGQARRKMPPRGNKDREEFERWYAANVR